MGSMGLGFDWVDACDEGFAANSGGTKHARLGALPAPPLRALSSTDG